MVGHQALNLGIGVRFPVPEHFDKLSVNRHMLSQMTEML